MSLGTLILSCQLADLVWPSLVLLGIERVAIAPGITVVTPLDFQFYPYSHSLVAAILWAALAVLLYRLVRRQATAGTLAVIAVAVISHWVLDVVTHRPDVPLTLGGSMKLGLELWRSKPATMVVELAMLAAGLALYARTTQPIDRKGSYALQGLVIFLVVTYLANMFGPPPPSAEAVAWTAQAIWLLVAWGYWVDQHRSARSLA